MAELVVLTIVVSVAVAVAASVYRTRRNQTRIFRPLLSPLGNLKAVEENVLLKKHLRLRHLLA